MRIPLYFSNRKSLTHKNLWYWLWWRQNSLFLAYFLLLKQLRHVLYVDFASRKWFAIPNIIPNLIKDLWVVRFSISSQICWVKSKLDGPKIIKWTVQRAKFGLSKGTKLNDKKLKVDGPTGSKWMVRKVQSRRPRIKNIDGLKRSRLDGLEEWKWTVLKIWKLAVVSESKRLVVYGQEAQSERKKPHHYSCFLVKKIWNEHCFGFVYLYWLSSSSKSESISLCNVSTKSRIRFRRPDLKGQYFLTPHQNDI